MQCGSGRRWRLIGLALVSMIAVDLFLHAGVLARWYVEPSPFLLEPAQAFARIPLGYLSFLLLAVLLVWMLERAAVRNWRQGGRVGLGTGALIWGAFALGLYSITTAPVGLLLGWFIGQTAELGVAGVVVGAGISGHHLGSLLLKVLALLLAAVLASIALQSLGIAPAIKMG